MDDQTDGNKARIRLDREESLRLSQKGEEMLKKAETTDVAFVMRACMNYEGSVDKDCPVESRALSISVNDFLQIKEKFNEDWWIGRIVKEGGEDGFVPSPQKLERKHYEQEVRSALRRRTKSTGGGRDASDCSTEVSRSRTSGLILF
jgi:voltage-dependent calcium channel beta-3